MIPKVSMWHIGYQSFLLFPKIKGTFLENRILSKLYLSNSGTLIGPIIKAWQEEPNLEGDSPGHRGDEGMKNTSFFCLILEGVGWRYS